MVVIKLLKYFLKALLSSMTINSKLAHILMTIYLKYVKEKKYPCDSFLRDIKQDCLPYQKCQLLISF